MVRVQHVDTTSGLLEQAFDLYSVEIHTAAGSHTIPLLETRDADELRRADRGAHAMSPERPPAAPRRDQRLRAGDAA